MILVQCPPSLAEKLNLAVVFPPFGDQLEFVDFFNSKQIVQLRFAPVQLFDLGQQGLDFFPMAALAFLQDVREEVFQGSPKAGEKRFVSIAVVSEVNRSSVLEP